MLTDNEAFTRIVAILRPITGGGFEVKTQTSLYHDLKVNGDDAWDFLEAFRQEFELTFEDFDFPKYFDSEGEQYGGWILDRLWFKSVQKKQLTVAHLIEVAKRGEWLAPDTSEEHP